MADDNFTDNSSNLDSTPSWHDPYSSVTDNGLFADTEEVTKANRLSKAKDTKLYALTKLNNGANLDDSYTDLGNGIVESNKNKIWNNLSDLDIQSLNAYAKSEKSLTRNDDGSTVNNQGNYLRNDTKWLYEFGTKDRESSVTKMGLARGDEDVTNRYIRYPSGELGVDVDQLRSSTLYTSPVATMLEAVRHGREQALANRVVKDRYTDTSTTDLLGGGSSEYYTSREGVLGAPVDVDMELGKKLFDEYMAKLPNRYRSSANREEVLPLSKPNSVINAASGFGATFINELIVKPLDALGDLTGLYDLDTNGDSTGAVEDFFGYDSRAVAEASAKVGEYWDTVSNSEATTVDRIRAAGNGMLEAFITPEMLGTSFGALMSWATPGTLLKAVGVGSKFAKAAKAIDTAVKAKTKTKMAGRIEKAKKFMELDGAKGFLAAQSGYMTSAMGNVNKQYEEFVANNNDVPLEGNEKAAWYAGRFAVQVVNQNIDKMVDFKVMKSPGVMKALVPAVKAMTNKEFGNMVKVMSKGVLKTTENASMEAAQEYTQTMMELFNSRFGSEQFKDLDTFTNFITDSRNTHEAGIASLMGAGGSGQFEFAGAVGMTSGISVSKSLQALGNMKKPSTVPEEESTSSEEEETIPPETVEANSAAADIKIDQALATYGSLIEGDELASVLFSEDASAIDTPNFKAKIEEMTSDYSTSISEIDEVEAIIESRVGTESESEEDADSLRIIKRTKRELYSSYMASEDAPTLGSGYSPEDVVAEFLDSVDVKEGELQITEEELKILNKFMKDKDVPTLRFESILSLSLDRKNALEVQEDIYGDVERSAYTYNKQLKSLVNTPNVSKPLVENLVGKIDNFIHSQEDKVTAFTNVITDIENNIAEYNKRVKPGESLDSAQKQVFKNIVKKGNNIDGFEGNYINIGRDKVTGKLSINKSSLDIVRSAEDNIKYLNRIKTRNTSKLQSILDNSYGSVSTGGILIRPNTKYQESREKDAKFYDRNKITKVVVDEDSAHLLWKNKGDYAVDNADLVNTGKYDKDDVVLIHTTAKTFTNLKLNKKLRSEISKVKKAGASIVLDSTTPGSRATVKTMNTFLSSYGMSVVNYKGAPKYLVKEEALKEREILEDVKKDSDKKKSTKLNALKALSTLKNIKDTHGSLSEAVSKGKITEGKKNYLEKSVADGLANFEGNMKNLRAHHATVLKKSSEAMSKEFISTRKKYGADSSEHNALELKYRKDTEIINEAVDMALDMLSSFEEASKEYSVVLSDWNAAFIREKTQDEDIETWIEKNVEEPRGVINSVLDSSAGKGRDPVYSVHKKNDIGLPTNKINLGKLPEDTLYQVLDLDPSLYTEVHSTTPLNSIPVGQLLTEGQEYVDFNDLVEGSVDLLNKTIKAPDLMYRGQLSIKDLSNSPALSFIYNDKSKPNANIAVAMRIAAGNYIRNSGYLLTKDNKTRADVAQLLGLQESQVSQKAMKMVEDKGMLYKSAADSVGKDIAALMGIRRKSDSNSDAQSFSALVADLGQTALLMEVVEGNLTIDSSIKSASFAKTVLNKNIKGFADAEGSTVLFIQAAKGKEEAFEEISAVSKEIEKLIPGSNTGRKEPLWRKPTKKMKDKSTSKIRNEKLGIKMPEKSKKAMNTLMDTEWVADLDAIRGMLEEEEALKARMGRIELEEAAVFNLDDEAPLTTVNKKYKALSYGKKQIQKSINRRLDAAFDEMRILTEITDEGELSMWMDYFFSKNGRFFINSNTINPQTEKHFHRFTTQPKSHLLAYKTTGTGKARKFFVDGKDITANVHYALAQAFGASTDKEDTVKNTKFAEKILTKLKNKKVVAQVRRDFIDDVKSPLIEELGIDLEHLGHALQGFIFLDKMLTKGNTFSSSITAEFDAVTSGFAHKNLQVPMSDTVSGEGWRKKTGFIHNDDSVLVERNLKNVSMNDVLDSGKVSDSYQTLAKTIRRLSFKEMLVGLEKKSSVIGNKYNENLWEALADVLPKLNEDGTVPPELRNLFKYPFMTFNYAASIKNIRDNLLVGDIMEGLVDKMASVDLKDGDTALLALMQAFVGPNGSVKDLQTSIRTKHISTVTGSDKSTLSLETLMGEMVNASYGAQVEKALNEEFSEFVAVQDDVNAAFKAMFEVFSIEFTAKVKEARRKGPVSAQDELDIYASLKEKFPAIKGPLSGMESDVLDGGIGIYATETSAPYGVHARRKAPRAKITDSLASKLGSKDIRVNAMLKQLAVAVAAGSVIPIHYIDGATMAEMVNDLTDKKVDGIVTIHDAIMVPLNKAGQGQESYNKVGLKVNSEYSFIHAINVQLQKVAAEVYKDSKTNKDYETTTVKVDSDMVLSVVDYVANISNSFGERAEGIRVRREAMFNKFDEKGISVMHMAGTPDGVHKTAPGEIKHIVPEPVIIPKYNKVAVNLKPVKKINEKAKSIKCGK